MKNHNKDALLYPKRCIRKIKKLSRVFLLASHKEPGIFNTGFRQIYVKVCTYFLRYITSFTNFTVLGTSGSAAATRFGA